MLNVVTSAASTAGAPMMGGLPPMPMVPGLMGPPMPMGAMHGLMSGVPPLPGMPLPPMPGNFCTGAAHPCMRIFLFACTRAWLVRLSYKFCVYIGACAIRFVRDVCTIVLPLLD